MMGEFCKWKEVAREQPAPPKSTFRFEIDDDAHCSITVGVHWSVLTIFGRLEQPFVDRYGDKQEVLRVLIQRTREVLATMEASLESSKPVDFPAEVDPVTGVER